ncbi:MAG: DUF2269 domain-containing protein [Pseudonocardiaceae bacterium]|nr:DUF2269 domain-containing protein [Pseudonocardiaceae bacterium]
MSPRVRKAVLTTHIATSVGWLGAVAVYIGLDVTAVTSSDVELVRVAYLAMEMITYTAVVPLALAAVLIGIINALGTPWGLFRHYWVLTKLLLTLLAATVLLIETRTISQLADAALRVSDPRDQPGTLPHSIGGFIVLLTATILSVYKPRGVTRYGWHQQQKQRLNPMPDPTATP